MAITLLGHGVDQSLTANGDSTHPKVSISNLSTNGCNLIVIGVEGYQHDPSGATVSDSSSNVYSHTAVIGSSDNRFCWWYCINPTVTDSMSFNVLLTGGYPVIAVSAWSGVNGGYDTSGGNSANGPSTLAAGALTFAVDGELYIAALSTLSTSGTCSYPTAGGTSSIASFTALDQLGGSGSNAQFIGHCYAVGTAGDAGKTVNSTWDLTTGLNGIGWACANGICFKPNGGGGGSTVTFGRGHSLYGSRAGKRQLVLP